MAIKLLVVASDNGLARRLMEVSASSEERSQLRVVARAEDEGSAIRLARELAPNIVILDSTLPGVDSALTPKRISELHPRIKVVVLVRADSHRQIVRILAAGAFACLPVDPDLEELFTAIETVFDGRLFISSRCTEVAVTSATVPAEAVTATVLSNREQEVLKLLADGRSSRQIGAALQISDKTVETHRSNIMAKLNIRTIAGLTKYAIKTGLSNLD